MATVSRGTKDIRFRESKSGGLSSQRESKWRSIPLKLGTLTTVSVLAAALPALAAPTCASPQVVQGNNCTLSTSWGWAAAGQGIASLVTIYVPPNSAVPWISRSRR